MTIAANMTKTCSPISINFSLKYCIMVFIAQTALAYFYSKEFIIENSFQPFYPKNSVMRVIAAMLLSIHI